MKHVLKTAIIALLGTPTRLKRAEEGFHFALVEFTLPLGFRGNVPLPLLFSDTDRSRTDRLQHLMLRQFGPNAAQCWRRHRRGEMKMRRMDLMDGLREVIREQAPPAPASRAVDEARTEIMDLTRPTGFELPLPGWALGYRTPTPEDGDQFLSGHLSRENMTPLPVD